MEPELLFAGTKHSSAKSLGLKDACSASTVAAPPLGQADARNATNPQFGDR